jgi:hypothetical protein
MGLLRSILQGLGIVQDIAENTRPTTTNVKDNKPEKRRYDFDDGTGYTGEDYLKARRKRDKARRAGKKPQNKDPKVLEERIR